MRYMDSYGHSDLCIVPSLRGKPAACGTERVFKVVRRTAFSCNYENEHLIPGGIYGLPEYHDLLRTGRGLLRDMHYALIGPGDLNISCINRAATGFIDRNNVLTKWLSRL